MRQLRYLLYGGLLLTVAGCGGGSTDYGSQARAAIEGLRSTIAQYDSATPTSVAATAAACRAARDGVQAQSALASSTSTGHYRAVSLDLAQAYRFALAGFSDCAGATRFDYLRLFRAAQELDTANSWLAKAKLDDPGH